MKKAIFILIKSFVLKIRRIFLQKFNSLSLLRELNRKIHKFLYKAVKSLWS